jgi:SAM-dependent methyltransferase
MDARKVDSDMTWAIEALPFVWGAQRSPNNPEGIPNELPFALSYDRATGRVIQQHSPVVAACLADVYERGSILGSNVDNTGAGRRYADDFLDFISKWLDDDQTVRNGRLLEIGCGNGYLLDRLRNRFDTVIGIEPGPQGQAGAERFGLNILKDFFPSPQLEGQKFSAIVLMSVFEHVEDPVGLASLLADYLEPDGRVFVSVPDEGPYIRNFDVSTLFHEHWSYFEQDTLVHTMSLGGLATRRRALSGYGGSAYAELAVATESVAPSAKALESAISVAQNYIAGAKASCEELRVFCQNVRASGRSLGVYVPARFVNAMKISGILPEGVRFFDDDPGLVSTYYPGIPIAIENRDALVGNPVDTLIIMSRTFGSSLRDTLRSLLPGETAITLISELPGQAPQEA